VSVFVYAKFTPGFGEYLIEIYWKLRLNLNEMRGNFLTGDRKYENLILKK
jgi:hypothetical protein